MLFVLFYRHDLCLVLMPLNPSRLHIKPDLPAVKRPRFQFTWADRLQFQVQLYSKNRYVCRPTSALMKHNTGVNTFAVSSLMMNICSNSIQFYRPLLYLPCESVGTIVVLHLHGAVLIILAGEVSFGRTSNLITSWFSVCSSVSWYILGTTLHILIPWWTRCYVKI